MPRHCVVPGCTAPTTYKASRFKVPHRDSPLRAQWEDLLGVRFGHEDIICAMHFNEDEIIRNKVFYDHLGNVIASGPLKCPKLKDDAIPSIGIPNFHLQPDPHSNEVKSKRQMNDEASSSRPLKIAKTSFSDLFKDVPVPSLWSQITPINNPKHIIFGNFITKDFRCIPFKEICIDDEGNAKYTLLGKDVSANFGTKIVSKAQLENELNKFNETFLCISSSVANAENVKNSFQDVEGNWRHKLCPYILYQSGRCHFCTKLKITLSKRRSKISFNVLKRYRKLRWRFQKEQALNRRYTTKIKVLKNQVRRIESKMNNSSIEKMFENFNLNNNEKTVIKEIVSAANCKSPKGHRFSEHWLLLCLLMNMRSPAAYNFIKNNKILPLPSTRTVRNYLGMVNMKCGFDEDFFNLFKKRLQTKTDLQKHGILLFDEILVRESVSVNSRNLTYIGLADYGDAVSEKKGKDLREKANHGLVFMFQPLADTYTQPIAVFASKGPVDGITLSQLVIKAIYLLEKTGAYVHGFVADGATTNRKVWKELGVSGAKSSVKNCFQHPLDETRKVFVFSDTPHLIKCIRNRLFNQGTLQVSPEKGLIEWNHFRILYNVDTKYPANLRLCHKINYGHVELTTTSKMRVKLATQIFSNSVSNGLKFYSTRVPELINCEVTWEFCSQINDMFDALNRRNSCNGLNPASSDFAVLKNSIQWLDQWEEQVEKGNIEPKLFLSQSTAEGLRVTLHSAIEMCEYLIGKYSFKYLLTGKINQDPLEKFFGTIRQAGGQNDHPSTPTFLQLYKILSVYSILRPPKYGNCTVTEKCPPEFLITISDLKAVYGKKDQDQEAKKKIKEKMDGVIHNSDWEVDDVFDTTATFADAADCIIQGYLCKQVSKRINCTSCLQSIVTDEKYSRENVAQVTNMLTKGGLIHPNIHFFKEINQIESIFAQFVNEADVFDKTLEHILDNVEFTFPCKEHKEEIFVYIIKYYLTMRMRQHTREENKKNKKQYADMKKKAKFSKN